MTDVYIVIYTREDSARVEPILTELRKQGIQLWDKNNLRPGENWYEVSHEKMGIATGVIVFVSASLMTSEFMHDNIEKVAKHGLDYIVPVVLDDIIWPAILAQPPQAVIAVNQDVPAIAQNIIAALKMISPMQEQVQEEVMAALAGMVAESSRSRKVSKPDEVKKSVFIVHGHDMELLRQVEEHLKNLNIEPVVLVEIGGAQLSLFQKFLRWSEDVHFAIVLISADDYGASRRQYDEPSVADRALQFRMRQNVLLELGFFYGYLGWENVFVLVKPPDKVFPNFEMPSDLGGILFDQVDPSGEWKTFLNERLKEAGFKFS